MTALMGGVLSAPTVAGILSGCTASTDAAWTPATLTSHQNDIVTAIAERIIPATDTPGAEAAHVNRFIDAMLTESWFQEQVDAFTTGIDCVDDRAERDFGSDYLNLSDENQIALLTALDDEAFGPDAAFDSDAPPFFRIMKELTVVGYYTSEIGASQELQINMVPGRWDGCVPLSDVGRAWA
ncbi:MAG: gluconate 2-dehydrogenase subunit 3 family protein [Rhodothermales bacterium]